MFPSAFFWRRQSSTFRLLAPLLVTASFTWMSRGSHTFRQFAASAAMSATTTTTASSSSRPNKAALVFLHGLGDGPWGWAHLQEELPRLQPRLAASNGIRYVFPAAPTIPIAINGGARMPGWFDLYDWPISVGAKDDVEGKLKAVAQIETEIQKLVENEGIPRNRIVVGGFSQGGAIALLTAYSNAGEKNGSPPPPLAACVSLSGWLTMTDTLNIPPPNLQVPLFWGHGQYDDKVEFPQQAFGVQTLTEKGVTTIEAHAYPMGHSSHPQEMTALAAFLDRVLFENDNDSNGDDGSKPPPPPASEL